MAKGMISEVMVTDGPDGELPEAAGTIVGVDFAYGAVPALHQGANVVRLRNQGQQYVQPHLCQGLRVGSSTSDSTVFGRLGDEPAG